MVGGKGEGKEKLREAGDEEVGWNKLNEKLQEKDLAIQLGTTHLIPLVASLSAMFWLMLRKGIKCVDAFFFFWLITVIYL